MYFDFNVTGPERKRLVQAISKFTGADARYLGAPTFAYQVDRFTVSKDGVVSIEGGIDRDELGGLMEKLVNDGFVSHVSDCGCEDAELEAAEAPAEDDTASVNAASAEELGSPQEAPDAPQEAVLPVEALTGGDTPEAPQEAAVGETCGLCVELPRDRFTDAALENLRKLVDSK
ncbi:MAG: virulence protein, partial [Oscillibacter sp.]|nr:virulence protein [Oscillibacter sp.]